MKNKWNNILHGKDKDRYVTQPLNPENFDDTSENTNKRTARILFPDKLSERKKVKTSLSRYKVANKKLPRR